jgi:protease I
MVELVKAFEQSGKLIATVCHGPQLLIAAHLVKGRTLTAKQTIQGDLQQIGATVKDEPVVVERNWITSRKPADLRQFSEAIVEHLEGEGAEASPAGRGPRNPRHILVAATFRGGARTHFTT